MRFTLPTASIDATSSRGAPQAAPETVTSLDQLLCAEVDRGSNSRGESAVGSSKTAAAVKRPLTAVASRRSTTDSTVALEVLPASAWPQVKPLWAALEIRLHSVCLASSVTWTDAWLKSYGRRIPHEFLLARRGGELVGVCLLTHGVGQSVGPLPLRTRHLGTAGEPDSDSVVIEYNSLLAEPASRAAFLLEILEYLLSRRDWDEFHLDGFEPRELDWLAAADPRFLVQRRETFAHDLAASRTLGDQWLNQFSAQTRRSIRRCLKQHATAEFEWAETYDQAWSIFTDLVILHQERWNSDGEPGCYASVPFYNFHRELLRTMVADGRMVLCRVTHEGQVLGCIQLFVQGRLLLNYQGGHAPYCGTRSPGVLTDMLTIEAGWKRGYDLFDFMAGGSYHKSRLSNVRGELVWLTLRRTEWKHRLVDALRSARQLLAGRFGSLSQPAANNPTANGSPSDDDRGDHS